MRTVVQLVVAVIVMITAVSGATSAVVDSTAVSLPMNMEIASISPAPDEVVGVAHPIVVTFSGPIADRKAAERSIAVTSNPPMTGTFEWTGGNVVQWKPDRYWPAHTTMMLSVGSRSTQLVTGPAIVGVADISDHTFTVTVDGQPTGPAPHHLPHAGEQGVLLASMGRPDYPTPVATYTVLSKDRTVTMDSSSVGIPVDDPDGYLLKVDYAVRISSRGLYVHSAPWAVNSMGFDNTSHGCISLAPATAEWYYDTAQVGDPVIVQE